MITSGGNTGGRFLRLADGGAAAISSPGVGRFRFNPATQFTEISDNGRPYRAISSAPTYTRFWVHPLGDDAMGAPDIARPFQHIQAAVNAALALGPHQLRISIAPADYAEDVVVNVAPDIELIIDGKGVHATSMTVNGPSSGQAVFVMDDLELGPSALPKPSLAFVVTTLGTLWVDCSLVEVRSNATLEACRVTCGGGGQLNVAYRDGRIEGTTAFSAAVTIENAEFQCWHTSLEGTDRAPVALGNNATFISTVSRIAVAGANQDCVQSTGTTNTLLFFDSICETDPASNGHAASALGPNSVIVWRTSTFISEGGTGGLNNPGGSVVLAGGGKSPGGGPGYGMLLPVIAANIQYWQMADTTGYLNTTSGLPTTNVQAAIDTLAKPPVVDKGTNYTFLASDNRVLFTNALAPGAIRFTLPIAARGLAYSICVVTGSTIQLDAAPGEQIQYAATSGSSLLSTGNGCALHVVARDTARWIVLSRMSDWTVIP